jgi:hypothetical protein
MERYCGSTIRPKFAFSKRLTAVRLAAGSVLSFSFTVYLLVMDISAAEVKIFSPLMLLFRMPIFWGYRGDGRRDLQCFVQPLTTTTQHHYNTIITSAQM